MKTSDIINNICSHLRISKAGLAKRMGLHPSSLYRKLSNESMTLEELESCLDLLGVSLELQFNFTNGDTFNSHGNYEQLIDKVDMLENKLKAAEKVDAFRKKSLRELRTELNSAVGYIELCRRHPSKTETYLNMFSNVYDSMERTISNALGDTLIDESYTADPEKIKELKGKTILLADDNELNSEILEQVLSDNGLYVEKAGNGIEALAAVSQRDPGYYRFILMDIEMPEMDGYEATLRIRNLPNRIRANTPIVAYTANAVSESRDKAFSVGMDGFLVKPVNTSKLLCCLTKLL